MNKHNAYWKSSAIFAVLSVSAAAAGNQNAFTVATIISAVMAVIAAYTELKS